MAQKYTRTSFISLQRLNLSRRASAEFSQTGGTYTPYPDPRSHRIPLADLAKPEVQERLLKIWTAPASLDPTRISAQVTREVATLLAQLAKSLEGSYSAEVVASYLTRSLFSMFAEDVELLPKDAYKSILKKHRDKPETLQKTLRALWQDMDKGGFSGALQDDVLHFNGKLFKGADAEGYSLLLAPEQVDLLIKAAKANWREVEPAIFGTLLERALDPNERHALGAHYTPRAYVERLIVPTVIEPLRADWSNAQAAALVLEREAWHLEGKPRETKLAEARAQVQAFLHTLCSVRVLDPACGSGNFLYVTLEHLKRLEGEVLNLLEALGHRQDQLDFEGETVTLKQLLGIELNQRAAALAELVLWIGYLQWQLRSRGPQGVAEPVVHNYGNIECRDAVLAWDSREPALDANGQPLSRWDGQTYKKHPVTGEPVPDENARVPQWRYVGACKAQWPQADFIVGNPPFIGPAAMRDALGDGYTEALRHAWQEVPDSADFVMFWWQHAAAQVAEGHTRRMGLITTNSLRQTFNRRVVQAALNAGTHLHFAIPDHPWVDSANGAAVRIAMTVLAAEVGVGNDPVYVKSRCFEAFPFPDEDTGLTLALRSTISEKAEQIDAHRKQVLAAGHQGLTLTGIYNVLEALRTGRELTAKERTHHTQGLVGVLRELHDELDAAVLTAYGLPADADTGAVLHRLVQLNAERAREEAQGRVRWLRPDFQNPAAQAQLLKPELPAQSTQALEAKNTQNPKHTATAHDDGETVATPATKTVQQAWPATLPEQVRAVADVLAASPVPLSLPALAAHFKGRGPWKKSLPTLLQTLEALGRVHGSGEGDARMWQSWQM